MNLDRTLLAVLLLLVAGGLGLIFWVSRRLQIVQLNDAAPRERVATVIVVAAWFGLVTGTMQVLLYLINRYIRNHFLFVGPQMFWMTPLSYLLIFAGIGAAAGAVGFFAGRRRVPAALFGGFAALGVFSLLLPFPQIHSVAAAVAAAGVGVQTGRMMNAKAGAWLRIMRVSTRGMLYAVAVTAVAIHGGRYVSERAALAGVPAATTSGPNVLLIVLDTVRAESLSLYGYGRPTTPHLERMAQEGAAFDVAMSSGPWTLKSHGTMFSGLYSQEIEGDFEQPVSFTTPVLAEVLQRRGYVTGGFVANVVYASWESGLTKGFVHYDDYQVSLRQLLLHSWIPHTAISRGLAASRSAGDVLRAVTRLNLTVDAENFNSRTYGRRTAPEVSQAFLDWQARQSGKPFFAFINFFDAHYAYRSPREFQQKFALTDNRVLGAYDAAIAYIDSEIDRVLAELRQRGVLDNTIVIVTSDHGEQFGEHGLTLHGNSLYSQLLHVPLVIRYPPAVPAGIRVTDPVTLRDLPATIAELARVSPQPFPGTPLTGFWNSGDKSTSPVSAALDRVIRPRPHWPAAPGPMHAMFDARFHYIRRADGVEQLFEYRTDPGEVRDLHSADASRQHLNDLRTRLDQLLAVRK